MAHKSFKAQQRAEEITFDFEGEIFRCVEHLDAEVMMAVAGAYIGRDDAGVALQVLPFFNSCLREDDAIEAIEADSEQGIDAVEGELSSFARFQKVLKRKVNRIDIETLSEIMHWLTETYTNRPTQRPSGSSPGPQSMGENSKGVSSLTDIAQEWPVRAGSI